MSRHTTNKALAGIFSYRYAIELGEEMLVAGHRITQSQFRDWSDIPKPFSMTTIESWEIEDKEVYARYREIVAKFSYLWDLLARIIST